MIDGDHRICSIECLTSRASNGDGLTICLVAAKCFWGAGVAVPFPVCLTIIPTPNLFPRHRSSLAVTARQFHTLHLLLDNN
jgi:hypothetical protein